MPIDYPKQYRRTGLSAMDEDAFFAVVTLLCIFLISGLICVFFILKWSQTMLWYAHLLLFSVVLISGTISMSSLIIAVHEVRKKESEGHP
jgi:hypothetical protein